MNENVKWDTTSNKDTPTKEQTRKEIQANNKIENDKDKFKGLPWIDRYLLTILSDKVGVKSYGGLLELKDKECYKEFYDKTIYNAKSVKEKLEGKNTSQQQIQEKVDGEFIHKHIEVINNQNNTTEIINERELEEFKKYIQDSYYMTEHLINKDLLDTILQQERKRLIDIWLKGYSNWCSRFLGDSTIDPTDKSYLPQRESNQKSILKEKHPFILLCLKYGIDVNEYLTRKIQYSVTELKCIEEYTSNRIYKLNLKSWKEGYRNKKTIKRERKVKDSIYNLEKINKLIEARIALIDPIGNSEAKQDVSDTFLAIKYLYAIDREIYYFTKAIAALESQKLIITIKDTIHHNLLGGIYWLSKLVDIENKLLSITTNLKSCLSMDHNYLFITFSKECRANDIIHIINNTRGISDTIIPMIVSSSFILFTFKEIKQYDQEIAQYISQIEEIVKTYTNGIVI